MGLGYNLQAGGLICFSNRAKGFRFPVGARLLVNPESRHLGRGRKAADSRRRPTRHPKSKFAGLLHPAHRQFTVLNPTHAAPVQPSHLKAACCVAAIATLVEVLDCSYRIFRSSLTHQIALAKTPAPAPPSKVARPLEQNERLRSILLDTLATAVQRAQKEATRTAAVVTSLAKHFLAVALRELD